jgi:ribosomal protein L11 methyltransferase
MTQIRISLTAAGGPAKLAYAALEAAFEDESFPLGIMEIDEAADLHEVTLYVDEAADEIEGRMRAALAGIAELGHLRRETVPDIDWVAHSLERLQPVRAGRFFVHGRHSRGLRRANDLAIEIEAAQAFGTGHHGTTAGCLEMIARILRNERPRRILDLGTGSAVLAIGIARMAHVEVLATDIDPVAVRVAQANIGLNGVQALVETRVATGFGDPAFSRRGPFDLIVANILAGPLMKLALPMARHLAPGGSLILSGILDRQRRAVLAAYANQRFRHVATLHREGWTTLHLKRR